MIDERLQEAHLHVAGVSVTGVRSRARDIAYVAAFTVVGLIIRAIITYKGSVWADEGSFLNIVAAPTWREMIAFLKIHESHPPLFYLLMRGWSQIAGGTDVILMIVPLLIGAAIVPVMFVAGRQLFSERVGIVAACIAAVAPQLTEHASQLRPYGLLSLCAVGSVSALAICMTAPSRRSWTVYVASTATMLYTHNWAWMIVAGELGAALALLRHQPPDARRRSFRTAASAMIVVLALYSPWIPSLVFQSQHAGHGALPIDNAVEYASYVIFSVNRVLETLVIGRLGKREVVAIVALFVASVAVVLTARLYKRRQPASGQELLVQRAHFMLRVAIFATIAALVVSPFNYVLLPRGVATVMPLLLLASAYWLNEIVLRRATPVEAQLAAVVFSFALVGAVFETAGLIVRPRSNVGKIAESVRANARPDDLLIVAPEWFAASFDHYFPKSIEQIDYPFEGRATMIDFADVWNTRTQSRAVERINRRLEQARRARRRVWFVFERRYTREFTDQQLAKAYRHRHPGILSARDVRRIRMAIENLYGPPETIFEANKPVPINDELLAYLYAP